MTVVRPRPARTPSRETDRRREHAEFRAHVRDRDPSARERLIREHLPLANAIARRFDRGGRVALDDLKQVAALGLIKAADRFDPERGTAFAGYAVPTIQGEIRRYLRDFSWTVRPPRDLQELALRAASERERLTTERRRNPTAAELAQRLDCTIEDILDATQAACARDSDSLDRLLDDQVADDATLGERLGAEDPGFAAVEADATLNGLLATLSRRDALILHLRFREDLAQAEIGRRVGYSQMQVSRVLHATLARLADAMDMTES